MLRIRSLGGLSVQLLDGRNPASSATQPRRLAVLARIARAGSRGVTRDALIALLWPDVDEEGGRRALSQALYGLRSGLDAESLFTGTQELRLTPEVATCDTAAFDAAVAAGDLDRAASLYEGPFLEGFRVPNAPDFDRWVDAERSALRHRHHDVLERLATRSAASGDLRAAVGWWRRRAADDPLDARVAKELMKALAAAGDRAGAVQHSRIYGALIAQELDLPADRSVIELAEKLQQELVAAASAPAAPVAPAAPASAPAPASGLAAIAPAAAPAAAPDPAPLAAAVPTQPAPTPTPARPTPPPEAIAVRPPARRHRVIIAAAALVAAVSIAAAFMWMRSGPEALHALGTSQRITFEAGLEMDPVVSPDGRLVAYAAGSDNMMRLYVRQVGGGRPIRVSNDPEGSHRRPRWSPDGRQLLFQAARGIWSVPALGGAAREVVPAPRDPDEQAASPEWSRDGSEFAYVVDDSVIVRRADGSAPRVLGVLDGAHSLAWSPDGRWMALALGNSGFVYGSFPWQGGLAKIGNLAPSAVWLLPTGGGEPVRVTDESSLNTSPTWIGDGRTLAFVSNRDGPRDIYTVPVGASGPDIARLSRLTTGLGAHTLAATRDGQAVAYSVLHMQANVWALPIDQRRVATVADAQQVTHGEQTVEGPAVSPDGRVLVFDSDRSGRHDLWKLHLDAADAEPTPLVDWPSDDFRPGWSADGRWIAFHTIREGVRTAGIVSASGGAPRLVFPRDAAYSHSPALSPDGRRLVFFRAIGNEWQLFESSRKDAERDTTWSAPRLLAGGRVDAPQWSPDGSHVAYVEGTTIRLLPMTAGAAGTPRTLVAAGDPRVGDAQPVFARWLPDARALIVRGVASDGATLFWRVPIDGSASTLLARVDDPRRAAVRPEFSTDGRRIFLALAERESDAWLLEVRARR